MSVVYVVMGSTGEYSDREEWAVVAFTSENAAKRRVEEATRRANEIMVMRPSRYHAPEGLNEFDPGMQMDYTGTSYSYMIVELIK